MKHLKSIIVALENRNSSRMSESRKIISYDAKALIGIDRSVARF